MKFAKALLTTAAVIALTAPAFAQVTPGGPGDRKNNQSPPMTATQSPAGAQPMTQADKAKGKTKARTTGMKAGTSASDPQGKVSPGNQMGGPKKADDSGDRKANEAPGMRK